MSKQIVFITGANTGIGFETVKALVQSPTAYHILLGSRTPSNADAAIAELKPILDTSVSTIEPVQVDVTDDASIQKAAEHVQSTHGRLDVLINNAGASFDSLFSVDTSNFRSVFNRAWDVNVTGAQVTTATFAPLLIKGVNPRLIFLTSGLSTLQGHHESNMPPWVPPPGAGWPKDGVVSAQGYKASKAGLNMLMLTWHWILKGDGVRTWAISPGFLATNLGGKGKEFLKKAGAGDASIGGELIAKVVAGERDEHVGMVVSQDGVQPF